MLLLLMAHPHPNVLSDSSKVARFTLGQGSLRVVRFSTDKEIRLSSNVRTAGGASVSCVYTCRFCMIIVAAWNHEGSVFYVRRSSTVIITCFFCTLFYFPFWINGMHGLRYYNHGWWFYFLFESLQSVMWHTGALRHTRRTWVAIPLIRLDFIFCLVCSALQHSDSFFLKKKKKENGAIYARVIRPLFGCKIGSCSAVHMPCVLAHIVFIYVFSQSTNESKRARDGGYYYELGVLICTEHYKGASWPHTKHAWGRSAFFMIESTMGACLVWSMLWSVWLTTHIFLSPGNKHKSVACLDEEARDDDVLCKSVLLDATLCLS